MKRIIYTAVINIALITNSLAQEPPPEIYHQSPDTLAINPDLYNTSGTINRPLEINSATGFNTNTETIINGSISSPNNLGHKILWKMGSGHMELNAANTYFGVTTLYEGSLTLGHNLALGDPGNTLEVATGSTLIIKPGLEINNQIHIENTGNIIKPAAWNLGPAAANNLPATIQVDQGTATLNGLIRSADTINKTGNGTLAVNGMGNNSQPLNLLQGGLAINGIWMGHINSTTDTKLSGTGFITSANITGQLNPGTATTTGQININQLELTADAITTIRIQNGSNDSIYSGGNAKLDGTLAIQADNAATGTYTIVSAAELNHSRFKQVQSPKNYISPTIKYNDSQICAPGIACQTVTLNLQYNQRGLNYGTADWQAGTIMDSRFIRDTAIAHSASGGTWARTWFANSEWHKTDRDTSGIQLGKSINIKPNSQIAIFAGAQHTNWRQGIHANDTAIYAGLGYSQTIGPVQIKLGHAIAKHRGNIKRQADPNESHITAKPRAINNQSWLHISTPININPTWSIKPYAQITHIHSKLQAYHENGSHAAIESPDQSQQNWLGQIGINIENQWDTRHGPATMQAHIGISNNFSRNYLNNRQKYRSENTTYTVHSQKMPNNSIHMDLGVKSPIAKHSTVELAYTGEYSSQQKQHGIWAGLNIKF